jgi:hypothetical protein
MVIWVSRRKKRETPLIQKLESSALICRVKALACSRPHCRMLSFSIPMALMTCELRASA